MFGVTDSVSLADLSAAAQRVRDAEHELRRLARLAAANEIPDVAIARAVGVHRLTIARWRSQPEPPLA
jgi:hypothetical protein